MLSFEVGLFGWIAVVYYFTWTLPIDSPSWRFMMQVAMLIGFLTSWPVNRWLLRQGIKEPMPTA